MRSLSRYLMGTAVAVAVLALAPPATAVTIGSDLSRAPSAGVCSAGLCTLVQQYTPTGSQQPLTAPANGVLVRWRVRVAAVGAADMRLRVARPAPYGYLTIVASSEALPAVAMAGGVNVMAARLPVKQGDRLALDAGPGWTLASPATGGTLRYWYPIPATGATAPAFTGRLRPYELALNADVEPDRDGDGYGDETQDLCATDERTHGHCPPPPPPPPPPPLPPDRRPPGIRLTASSVQTVERLFVGVVLDELGTTAASGSIKLPHARRAFELRPVTAGLQANRPTRVQLRLRNRNELRSTIRALSRGLSPRAVVRLVARDAAGNVSSATRSVLLSR